MCPTERLLDAAGHQRSPVTMPGYHQGRPPKNKGLRFPADPPPVEEIIAVMGAAGNGPDGARLRALIIVLWRAGLRISEALDLAETDLDRSRGAVVVRAGKGGRRREVGMDRWAWGQLTSYLEIRATLPVGALFCVMLTAPPPGGAGRPPRRVSSCVERRKWRASVGALRLIS
jgi:integrase